jgi:hypothetical protein
MAPEIPRSGALIPALGNTSNLIIDYNFSTLPEPSSSDSLTI